MQPYKTRTQDEREELLKHLADAVQALNSYYKVTGTAPRSSKDKKNKTVEALLGTMKTDILDILATLKYANIPPYLKVGKATGEKTAYTPSTELATLVEPLQYLEELCYNTHDALVKAKKANNGAVPEELRSSEEILHQIIQTITQPS